MNADENKRMLWDLTNHLYKSWMSREQVISMFEKTINEFNDGDESLIEKNKRFLSVYVERVASIQPIDAEQRAAMFEERLKARNTKKAVTFEPEVIEIAVEKEKETFVNMNELTLLKEEIRLLKDKINTLEKHCFRT
jgi:hypothetical protein